MAGRIQGGFHSGSVAGKSVEDALAVVQTHVGDVPVLFLSDAAEDAPEGLDVGEAGACDFAVGGFERAADEERGGRCEMESAVWGGNVRIINRHGEWAGDWRTG